MGTHPEEPVSVVISVPCRAFRFMRILHISFPPHFKKQQKWLWLRSWFSSFSIFLFYLWGMALQFSLRDFYDFACRCFWLLSNANCFIIMQSNLCQLCLLMCLFCFGFPDNAGSWITFNKWNKFQKEPLECQS